ncbi:hypothetical protein GJ496_006511 [Pomphorhynchus laevis]|nr:hypothetical protein GJ496_006511 [Pomphorhynchus laevis]
MQTKLVRRALLTAYNHKDCSLCKKLFAQLCSQTRDQLTVLISDFQLRHGFPLNQAIKTAFTHCQFSYLLQSVCTDPVEWLTLELANCLNQFTLQHKTRLLTIIISCPYDLLCKVRLHYKFQYGFELRDHLCKHNLISHHSDSLLDCLLNNRREFDGENFPDVISNAEERVQHWTAEQVLSTSSWKCLNYLCKLNFFKNTAFTDDTSFKLCSLILEYAMDSHLFWSRRLTRPNDAMHVKLLCNDDDIEKIFDAYLKNNSNQANDTSWLSELFNYDKVKNVKKKNVFTECIPGLFGFK